MYYSTVDSFIITYPQK